MLYVKFNPCTTMNLLANFWHRVGLRRCAANPTYGFRFLLGLRKTCWGGWVKGCETISGMDDPHGCGKFPEAPGARRDAADEPTRMYPRRVSHPFTQPPTTPIKHPDSNGKTPRYDAIRFSNYAQSYPRQSRSPRYPPSPPDQPLHPP